MNELLFFLHIIIAIGAILVAVRVGCEALVAAISLLFVLANVFVSKQINLFSLNVTAADVYIIAAAYGFNLLHEYFGEKIAKKTVWISFFISFIAVVFSQMHMWYTPNVFDSTQSAFTIILGLLPRIMSASFIAHIVAQYFQVFLYGMLKKWNSERFFVGRNVGVVMVAQLIDTILFSVLGLYGVVHSLVDITVLSFIIKGIEVICAAPLLAFARRVVNKPFETYLETNALRSPRHSSGKTGERYSFAIKDELRREVLKNNKNKKKEEAKNPLP